MQKLGGEGLILIVGSRLVSGKYSEPEEPIGVNAEIRHVFADTFLTEKKIGALSPVIL